MPSYFPILLVAHIILAVSLVLPSILLPFALRTRRAAVESGSPVVQWPALGADPRHDRDRARAGADRDRARRRRSARRCSSSRGCSLALTIYFVNLGIAFFIQRPNLRRLIGVRAAADDKTWLERAKRQRYVSYLMAGLVGTIGFLMSSKPVLW